MNFRKGRKDGFAPVQGFYRLVIEERTLKAKISSGKGAAARLYTFPGFRFAAAGAMLFEDTGRTEHEMLETSP